MNDEKFFIAETYICGKGQIVRNVHPYGLGIVVSKSELEEKIKSGVISGNVLTDHSLRVVI
jgi:hypothetical protein